MKKIDVGKGNSVIVNLNINSARIKKVILINLEKIIGDGIFLKVHFFYGF